MKRLLLPAMVLACATSVVADEKIQWITDYEAARAVSAATGRLMMVDFTAKW